LADDSLLLVRLEALGRELTNVTEWSINSNYITSTDGFEFSLYDENRQNLRGLELQPVELLVNGASQLLGRIDITEVGGTGSAVTYRGRDYIADLVECNVDPLVKIKEGDTIESAFKQVCGPVGIQNVRSEEDVLMRNVRTGINVKVGKGGRGYAKRLLNEYKPKTGEGIYEFLSRLIARFAATIQPGPDRETLVIGAPRYDQEPVTTLRRSADPALSGGNNIITSSAVRDYSSFPTFALFNGWAAKGDQAGSKVTQSYDIITLASAYNDEIYATLLDSTLQGRRKPLESERIGLGQLYRLLYFRDEEARTQEQIERSATRAIAERLKDTLEYRCTLRGHVDPTSGAIWSIDTMVMVEDEICGISEPLWIVDRTLSYSPGQGAMTSLTLYRPSSFQFGE
jgi:prophage tail gpP-like protein